MTRPGDWSRPNKARPSKPGPAAWRHQEEKPGESQTAEDPAEGLRDTIDRELCANTMRAKDEKGETERARHEQVEEDAELPERGQA